MPCEAGGLSFSWAGLSSLAQELASILRTVGWLFSQETGTVGQAQATYGQPLWDSAISGWHCLDRHTNKQDLGQPGAATTLRFSKARRWSALSLLLRGNRSKYGTRTILPCAK